MLHLAHTTSIKGYDIPQLVPLITYQISRRADQDYPAGSVTCWLEEPFS